MKPRHGHVFRVTGNDHYSSQQSVPCMCSTDSRMVSLPNVHIQLPNMVINHFAYRLHRTIGTSSSADKVLMKDTEFQTKWTPFRRWNFEVDFHEWKCLNSDKKISLKFLPKGPTNNIPALVQSMACRRPDKKPLSEPMMVRLTTHICATRPQVKAFPVIKWFDYMFAVQNWLFKLGTISREKVAEC